MSANPPRGQADLDGARDLTVTENRPDYLQRLVRGGSDEIKRHALRSTGARAARGVRSELLSLAIAYDDIDEVLIGARPSEDLRHRFLIPELEAGGDTERYQLGNARGLVGERHFACRALARRKEKHNEGGKDQHHAHDRNDEPASDRKVREKWGHGSFLQPALCRWVNTVSSIGRIRLRKCLQKPRQSGGTGRQCN